MVSADGGRFLFNIFFYNFIFWAGLFTLWLCGEYYRSGEMAKLPSANRKFMIVIVFFVGVVEVQGVTGGGVRAIRRAMDIPRIMANDYESMEGTVTEFFSYLGGNDGGSVEIENLEGKRYKFINVYITSELDLEVSDWVKVDYWKYSRVGDINRINGREYISLMNYDSPLGEVALAYYLLVPLIYVLWNIRLSSFFWRFWGKEDYSICIYDDLFRCGILTVAISALQLTIIFTMALMRKYETGLDWYLGILLVMNYLGMVWTTFFRGNRLVLNKEKFYYWTYKQGMKRIEGEIKEITYAERVKKGVVLYTKGEKMKIWCTSEKHIEALLERIFK